MLQNVEDNLVKAEETKGLVENALDTAKQGLQGIEQALDMFFGGSKRNLFESSKKLMAFSLAQLEDNPHMQGNEFNQHKEHLRVTLLKMNSMNKEEQNLFVKQEILGLE